jgi:replicative DNA helicase
MMSDLRESGSIEQDSDIILLLMRRDYYDPYDKPGLAEVIVAKNRHGGVGTVNMTYRKEIGQFANYSPLVSGAKEGDNEEAFAPFSPKQYNKD